jgi:cellulose biosynthesis protein BcsQ
MRRIVIGAPHAGSGQSTLAANLATAAARGGRKTLLFDADPRGCLTEALGANPNRGIESRDGFVIWHDFRQNLDFAALSPLVETGTDLNAFLRNRLAFSAMELMFISSPRLRHETLLALAEAADEMILVVTDAPICRRALPGVLSAVEAVTKLRPSFKLRCIVLNHPESERSQVDETEDWLPKTAPNVALASLPHAPEQEAATLLNSTLVDSVPRSNASQAITQLLNDLLSDSVTPTKTSVAPKPKQVSRTDKKSRISDLAERQPNFLLLAVAFALAAILGFLALWLFAP